MPSFARLLGIGCWTAVAGHRLRTHPYQQLLPEASQPATRPATNLIRRRKVLRYGEQSGVPGPDLLTRSCFPMLPQGLSPGHSVQSPPRSGNSSAGSICLPDEAAAWPGTQVLDGKCCCCLAWVPFLQITARTNPCSRHLWGTLARSVASI